ncbi:MAG: hypothetical protein P8N50_02740, partial [Actinomycetota bacterium]|nr:hypothetical protein [Actinomycetota bacterium]
MSRHVRPMMGLVEQHEGFGVGVNQLLTSLPSRSSPGDLGELGSIVEHHFFPAAATLRRAASGDSAWSLRATASL